MAPKTAGIIIIGDEILKGHVVDTNSHFLCKRLHSLGVKVCKMSVVSDNADDIASEVAGFSQQYDLIFTSGGIGPTHDDITYLGIAKAFNRGVEINQDMAKILAKFYELKDLNDVDGNPALKMAQIPEHSKLLYLPKSFSYDKSHSWMNAFPIVQVNNVYIFPGIPRFFEYAAKNLEHLFKNPNVIFHTRELYVMSEEVAIAPSLNRAVEHFKDKVTFGSYPSSVEIATRIIMESTSKEQVEEASDYLSKDLPDGIMISSLPIQHGTTSVAAAVKVLEECCDKYSPSELFISFNGGKDCTALLHLTSEVLQNRFPNCKEPWQALYVQPQDPFPEVEEFIEGSITRYNINLKIVPGPVKNALHKLLQEKPHLKAVLMGTRRTDPYSEALTYFQMTDKDWPQVMRVSPLLDWSYKDVWTYLKDHTVPYCVLYDKGYTSLGSQRNTVPNPALRYTDSKGGITYYPAYKLEDETCERNGRQYMSWNLNDGLEFLENLDSVMCKAFGPEGHAIMVQQPTGQLSITRSGYGILSSIFPKSNTKHPVLQILQKCAENIHESFGDGIKTFIIMTVTLLKYCKVVEHKALFIRHLYAFQTCISETMHSIDSLEPLEGKNIVSHRKVCFENIIYTFFNTRFSEPVRNVLFPLMCKWILSYSSAEEKEYAYSSDILKMLQQKFALLCDYQGNIGRPVTESSVELGYWIDHPVFNLGSPGLKKLKLLMLEDGEMPESGQYSTLDVNSEVNRMLLNIDSANGRETLFVTSAVLSDLTLFLLRNSNIAVLHGLQHADVNFIYATIFHAHLGKTKEIIVNVRSIIKNDKEYTCLDLPNTFQLHICGPTLELSTEYAKECFNVIKLLVHSTMQTTGIPHVVKTNGIFEQFMTVKFMSKLDKNHSIPLLSGVRSRAELLALHEEIQKSLHKECLLPNYNVNEKKSPSFKLVKKNNDFNGEGVGCGDGICGGDGVDTIALENISASAMISVTDIKKNLKQNESIFCLQNAALLDTYICCKTNGTIDVSCRVLDNLTERCSELDTSVLVGIVNALQSVQRKLPVKIKRQGLEPLALKLGILQHVVNTVQLLLRIDSQISSEI